MSMIPRRSSVFIAVLALGLLGGVGVRAEDHCAALYGPIDSATASGNSAQLETLGQQLLAMPDCDTNRRTAYRRSTARALVRQAEAAGLSGAALQDRLKAAQHVAVVWEVLVKLGDSYADAGDFDQAAALYNRALNDMSDRLPGDPPPPDEATTALVFDRASELGMLGPTLSDDNRDGTLGGVDAVLIPGGRTLVTRPRLLPVTYEYARAVMTKDGLEFAKEWIETWRATPPAALVLIGNTDPDGDPKINETLSVARARALATFIRNAGFQGELRVYGFGQRCPINFTRPYSRDQQNQILRRVEVLAGTGIPPGYHCTGVADH